MCYVRLNPFCFLLSLIWPIKSDVKLDRYSILFLLFSLFQAELQEAVSGREEAIRREASARKDCSEQSRIAQEEHDKYELELLLHAADVEALAQIKEKMNTFQEKLFMADEIATKSTEELKSVKKTQTETELLYKQELDKMRTRITDLMKQNEVLHQELQQVSPQTAVEMAEIK